MTVSLYLPTWLLLFVLVLGLFGAAQYMPLEGGEFSGLGRLFWYAIASVLSLVLWLAYGVITLWEYL